MHLVPQSLSKSSDVAGFGLGKRTYARDGKLRGVECTGKTHARDSKLRGVECTGGVTLISSTEVCVVSASWFSNGVRLLCIGSGPVCDRFTIAHEDPHSVGIRVAFKLF